MKDILIVLAVNAYLLVAAYTGNRILSDIYRPDLGEEIAASILGLAWPITIWYIILRHIICKENQQTL